MALLHITLQPSDFYGAIGERSNTFHVEAVGTGVSYQWQVKETADASWRNASSTGYNTDTWNLQFTASRQNYQFRCKVSDSSGNSVYSDVVRFVLANTISKVVYKERTLIDLTEDTVTAAKMLSGTKAHSKSGARITGTIASKSAATYNTSASDQTIASGQYLSGTQTIKAVTTSNISAGNIKTGVVVKVGDENSAGRIINVTGTFTSDADAAAGNIYKGKTAYVNGSKITGTAEVTVSGETLIMPDGLITVS